MSLKSQKIIYSLGRHQTASGFLLAHQDGVIGFAFSDPVGRLTFFSFDTRLKELEKVVFRGIEDIEGSIMTYLDSSKPPVDQREPAGTDF
jgi:hypothetical protein